MAVAKQQKESPIGLAAKYVAASLLCTVIGVGSVAFPLSGAKGSFQSQSQTGTAKVAQTSEESSPTATAKAFYDAVKARDVEGIKAAMSKGSLKMMEKFAKVQNKTLDEALKEPNNSKMPASFESRNEKINGDSATLEVKDENDKWDTLPFVKEDGQWKIALDKVVPENTEGKP